MFTLRVYYFNLFITFISSHLAKINITWITGDYIITATAGGRCAEGG